MGMILQILFAVVNLGVTGLGAYWVYAATLGWHAPSITEQQLASEREALEKAHDAESDSGPLVYTMDKFTVNLSGEPKRTIRVEVNLEMLGKDGFEEVINSDNRAKARDKIVRLLNDKTFGELESIQGKLFLKDRIATVINGILDKGVVKDVYFSEFVVQ
ncbi:MAG: flagellar protein FliL [Bdellovibrio sp. CG10_big_fil_rev_8_21_14_0_10_47_8]|nr:MAG: flagellar protein FliL [Bdellovibrio sp. CG10_big_fil_rev_8_21_14_0_10_47_8]